MEYLRTYYGSLCGGLEALMQHQIVLDPFENFSNDIDDDDDDDSADDRDNDEQHVNNGSDTMENMEDSDAIHARPDLYIKNSVHAWKEQNLVLKS